MGYFYVLLIVLGFTGVAFFTKLGTLKGGTPVSMMVSLSFFGALYTSVFLLLQGCDGVSLKVVLLAVAGGVGAISATLLLARAMVLGHYGLSVAIFSASFVLQVLASFAIFGEVPSFPGLLLVLSAIFMMALSGSKDAKGTEQKKKFWKWFATIISAFFLNGIAIIAQLLMSKEPGNGGFVFIFILYLSGGLILLPSMLKSARPNRAVYIFGALAGLGSVTGIFMTLKSLETLSPNVVFPVYFTGYMMAAALLSVMYFREKTSLLGYAGMAIGLAGIVILCIK